MGDNLELPYEETGTVNYYFALSSDLTNDNTLQAPAVQYYPNSAVELSTNTMDSATDRAFPGMAAKFVTPAVLQLPVADGTGVLPVESGSHYIPDTNGSNTSTGQPRVIPARKYLPTR